MLKKNIIFIGYTVGGALWRFFVALFDFRTWKRKLLGQAIVDAVFITNMRDETDRRRFLGLWRPICGHFNGPRYRINGVLGRTRALNITTNDLADSKGRIKAKELIISATRWADNNGVRAVLLAASLKHIFGNGGMKLKEIFPNIVFTIGDNGTFFLLKEETFRALKKAGIKSEQSRIAVLGPYGILGEMMTGFLVNAGYNVIGAGPKEKALIRVARKYKITTAKTFNEIGKVDAVVACTHNGEISLTAWHVSDKNPDSIRKINRRLLVVDVAEPSNFNKEEYLKCKDLVIRQDAGNAHSTKLKYVLGVISYRMFRLTRGVTFGCFAETLALAENLKKFSGGALEKVNHFQINEENMKIVQSLFEGSGFHIPSPRSHGKRVKSFDLEITNDVKMKRMHWKSALNATRSIFF